MGIEQALLTAITALVAAMVWLVKAITSRSDKLIEQRDKEVQRSFTALENAIKAFGEFEKTNQETASRVLDRLDRSDAIQMRVLEKLQSLRVVSVTTPASPETGT